jgi:hypothetical protein
MTQHAGLTEERWGGFTLDQQILMIGNEMNRGFSLVRSGESSRTKSCYERVLHLTDLTIRSQSKSTLRGELLRWRDLVADLYLADSARPDAHRQALRCLLQFTPEASRQIPFLAGASR